VARTNLLARPLVAGRRGPVNEREWAEKIRLYLVERGGVPEPQRALGASPGTPSL
jgi:hypothetical protein